MIGSMIMKAQQPSLGRRIVSCGLGLAATSMAVSCSAGEAQAHIQGNDALTDEAEQNHTPANSKPTMRENVIGSYEDRIRNFSNAERVFEFFASVNNDKGTFMTPSDFARAITPYQHRKGVKVGSDNFKYNFQAKHYGPSSEERQQYREILMKILEDGRVTAPEVREMLEARKRYNITAEAHLEVLDEIGVSQAQLEALVETKGGIPRDRFMAMVDMDGDGLISYPEFMLFRTLLAIPRRKLYIAFRMFDRDDSGAIDREEFESFMAVLRDETNVGRTEVARRHKEDAKIAHRLFFRGDEYGELTFERFSEFVNSLQREVLIMQFNEWDEGGEGTLTARNFAKFLVTKVNTDRRMYKEYLERAESDTLSRLEGKITLDDFLQFQDLLHHLPEMEVAMRVSGSVEGCGLNRDEFGRAVKAALQGGRMKASTQQEVHHKSGFLSHIPHKLQRLAPTSVDNQRQHDNGAKVKEGKGKTTRNEQTKTSRDIGIAPGVVDTLFALLDADGDGRLDQKEFMALMERQAAIPDPPRSMGVVSFCRHVRDCFEDTFL